MIAVHLTPGPRGYATVEVSNGAVVAEGLTRIEALNLIEKVEGPFKTYPRGLLRRSLSRAPHCQIVSLPLRQIMTQPGRFRR